MLVALHCEIPFESLNGIPPRNQINVTSPR